MNPIGAFLVTVSLLALVSALGAPANDNLADAEVLQIPTTGLTLERTNVGATAEPGEFFHADYNYRPPTNTVWFRIPAPGGGNKFTVTVERSGGPRLSPTLSVYRGVQAQGVGALQAIATEWLNGPDDGAKVDFQVPANNTLDYFVSADGYSGSTGMLLLKFHAPPVNDSFAGAETLEAGTSNYLPLSGDNYAATAQAGEVSHPSLAFAPLRSVWYRIPSPAVGSAFALSAYSFDFDLRFSVFRGNAADGLAGLVPVAAGIEFNLVEAKVPNATGGDYFVAIDGDDSGEFTLRLWTSPANDKFAAAETLTVGSEGRLLTDWGNTIAATAEAGEVSHSSHSSPPYRTVWYRIPSPGTGRSFRISVPSTYFSPRVSIFRGHAANGLIGLVPVAASTETLPVTVTVPNATGGDYFVAIDSGPDINDADIFQLELYVAPFNDDLANAISLEAEGIYPTDGVFNEMATRQTGEPGHPTLGTPQRSVWYRIKAPPQGASFTISTAGSNFDTFMTLYRGHILNSIGALQVIAGNNDSDGGTTSKITFSVPDNARLDYFIAVDGFAGASGEVKVSMTATPPTGLPAPSTVFPATSAEPHELFTGGADSFDLDGHSITLIPQVVAVNSHTEVHYQYSVRRIRELPENLSEIEPSRNYKYDISPPPGFQIFGETPSTLSANSPGSIWFSGIRGIAEILLLERPISFDAYNDIRVLSTAQKVIIQFDDYLTSGVTAAPDSIGNTSQVELFSNGMIRLSFLGMNATKGIVGLRDGSVFPPQDDLSAASVSVADVVVAENAGHAAFTFQLPAPHSGFSYNFSTTANTALPIHDFTEINQTTSIPSGSDSAIITVPIVNDSIGETAENFDIVIHAPGNPNWIFAKPKIWIIDDDAGSTNSGPRVHLSGSRVFVLPPDQAVATVTGFRLLSIEGGSLRNSLDQGLITPGASFSLAAGAAGLIASGPEVRFTVEMITAGGTSASRSVGFDVDGKGASAIFELMTQSVKTSEGRFASINVSASKPGASVSYEIVPLSAQPFANGSGDYLATVKTLEFKSGMATIEIPILADTITEGDEEFLVRLIDPSPGASLGPASRAKVVISDGNGELRTPFDQRLPTTRISGRSITRNFTPEGFPGQNLNQAWRFVGEPGWRPANSHAWNVREGFHKSEYQVNTSSWILFMAPDTYLRQPMNYAYFGNLNFNQGEGGSYGDFSETLTPSATLPTAGSLRVDLEPAVVAGATTLAERGQWRRIGESIWRDSGTTEPNVPAGPQLVEFRDDIPGYHAPTTRSVKVESDLTSTLTSRYQPRSNSGSSPIPVSEPDLRVSGNSWTHVPIRAQTGDFTVSFELKPSSTSINSLVGLSSGKATSETALSAILRVNGSNFQGWSSGGYQAANPLVHSPGKWHFVEFRVSLATDTYQLQVTPPTGDRVEILGSASFLSAASEISYLSMFSSLGSHSVRNVRVTENPGASDWSIVEFPDQTKAFDIALEVRLFPYSSSQGPQPIDFTFGLADGRPAMPTVSFGPLTLDPPESLGASYRYPPVILRLHIDLVSKTYQFRSTSEQVLASGSVPGALTKANHLYMTHNADACKISDSILPPASAAPTGLEVNVPLNWTHLRLAPQTGRFSLTCDIRTTAERVGVGTDLLDSIIGLSSAKVDVWNQVSVALRAKLSSLNTGIWDAHTGGLSSGSYARENDVQVVDGKLYHAVFHVDIPNQTYRIAISPDDGGPAVILQQGTFRRPATEIRYVTLRSVQGRLAVSNIRGPLPHPADSPPHFTGQIESPNGFGTGTVVADHAVLTSAKLVFDSANLAFTPGVSWRRSDGGYATLPNVCEPSNVVLVTSYAAAFLAATNGGSSGDDFDVAVLAFRPVDVPEYDNAPGDGAFSGFIVDGGSGAWSSPSISKIFPSFPVSGILAETRGRVHTTSLDPSSFSPVSNVLLAASGIQAPPGSEGAAVFARGADHLYRPAAICVGATGGIPRFRTIDPAVAEAIHQANDFQRQPGFLQDLAKSGVYYIPTTLARSTEPNRAHIYSDALPQTATWTLTRYESLQSSGGQSVSVEPGSYRVDFGPAPAGFSAPTSTSLSRYLNVGYDWHLPAVYQPLPAATYATWVTQNFDEFEAESSAVTAPVAIAPWLGTDNLTAYAFGFDPNSTTAHNADPTHWKPGYPLIEIDRSTSPPTFRVECLRRLDSKLRYNIESSNTLAGPWITMTYTPAVIKTEDGWDHASWTFQIPAGQPIRNFIRMRVTLDD